MTMKQITDMARAHALDALGKDQFNNNPIAVQSIVADFVSGFKKAQEFYSDIQAKAEKWDALEEKISRYYGDEEEVDQELEDWEKNGGLLSIGELAANAFGFL